VPRERAAAHRHAGAWQRDRRVSRPSSGYVSPSRIGIAAAAARARSAARRCGARGSAWFSTTARTSPHGARSTTPRTPKTSRTSRLRPKARTRGACTCAGRLVHPRLDPGTRVTGLPENSAGWTKWSRRPARCFAALFRPPLPEPCWRLSPHTALQLAGIRAGQPSASRLLPCPPAALLVPFALWPTFPAALVGRHAHDYYGTSVTLGLAPGRPSRFPSVIDVRA